MWSKNSSLEGGVLSLSGISAAQLAKDFGTPTFFLDGKLIEDNNTVASIEKFSSAIDAAIAAKTGNTPAATQTPAASETAPSPGQ